MYYNKTNIESVLSEKFSLEKHHNKQLQKEKDNLHSEVTLLREMVVNFSSGDHSLCKEVRLDLLSQQCTHNQLFSSQNSSDKHEEDAMQKDAQSASVSLSVVNSVLNVEHKQNINLQQGYSHNLCTKHEEEIMPQSVQSASVSQYVVNSVLNVEHKQNINLQQGSTHNPFDNNEGALIQKYTNEASTSLVDVNVGPCLTDKKCK